MSERVLQEKAYKFASKIVRLSQYLNDEIPKIGLSEEEILASGLGFYKEILDSGTAIPVLIEEAGQDETGADFSQKLSAAKEEVFKINDWLRVLLGRGILNEKGAQSLLRDCEELRRMLISSLKTTQKSE